MQDQSAFAAAAMLAKEALREVLPLSSIGQAHFQNKILGESRKEGCGGNYSFALPLQVATAALDETDAAFLFPTADSLVPPSLAL